MLFVVPPREAGQILPVAHGLPVNVDIFFLWSFVGPLLIGSYLWPAKDTKLHCQIPESDEHVLHNIWASDPLGELKALNKR
jgi:hypothetical protein